jgi:hypothetical protein
VETSVFDVFLDTTLAPIVEGDSSGNQFVEDTADRL